LLGKTLELLKGAMYKIGNIDLTIVLQRPRIAGYVPEMQSVLANILHIETNNISIKAKTNENLGFEGKEEGITVYAVALIYPA